MALIGSIPVIPTPFLNGKLHLSDFDRLIEFTADYLDGYVVSGSTGEAPALSKEERIQVTDYFIKKMPKGKEAVIGLGHTSVEEAIEIGKAAVQSGAKSALVPAPYYFPNNLNMIIDYVGKLAEGSGMDIVFYDNPVTTNTRFTGDDLIKLANAVPAVKAIKMTDHSTAKIVQLKAETDLIVFGGDDIVAFRNFGAGIDGSMIISPAIYPKQFRESWDAYTAGDRKRSYEIFAKVILPFTHLFGPGDEIPTSKALYKHLGIFTSAETRSPLLPSDAKRVEEILMGYEEGLNNIALLSSK